ncbi:hypothetical protein D3C72_1367750 [compost metagenome]
MLANDAGQAGLAAGCPCGQQGDGLRPQRQLALKTGAEQRLAPLCAEQVVVADKARHKLAGGAGVDLLRRAALDDGSLVHQEDPIRQGERLLLIVGHEDGGEFKALLDLADLLAQAAADAGIQRRERLVQQQDPRPYHQSAGQRHPLALTAGELPRIAALEAGQLHQRQRLLHAGRQLTPRLGLHLEAEGDVVPHRHVGEERIALEHHADAPLLGRLPGDVLTGHPHLTAIHRSEPGQRPQQGGLAAAGGAEQGHQLPLADAEFDPLEHRGLAVGFVQLIDF